MLSKLVVITVVGFFNAGDRSQADAIVKELKSSVPSLVETRLNADDPEDALPNLEMQLASAVTENLEDKKLILIIGEKGLSAYHRFYKMLQGRKDIYTYLGIHQFRQDILDVPFDQIGIPKSGLGDEEMESLKRHIKRCSFTFAVPTSSLKVDELKTFYDNWNIPNKLALDKKYIFVVLPGDAPDSGQQMRYFTEESAIALANTVQQLWQQLGTEYEIIIHNSPRTGKHNPKTGAVVCAHTVKQYEPNDILDNVSRIFIDHLKKFNLPMRFISFSFEKQDDQEKPIIHSALNGFYYLLNTNKHNVLIVPGESISMLGQAPLYADASQIIVYKPSSINESHEALLKEAFDAGYVSYFDENGKVINPKLMTKRNCDDAMHVAKEVIAGIHQKTADIED